MNLSGKLQSQTKKLEHEASNIDLGGSGIHVRDPAQLSQLLLSGIVVPDGLFSNCYLIVPGLVVFDRSMMLFWGGSLTCGPHL